MSIRNLHKLFKPEAIALIGATPRPGSLGAVLGGNLRKGGFSGRLMLVNPHHQAIDGLPVYPDVAGLPEVPDLAVIATPPGTVPGLVAELGARGTRAAIVITAGFGEQGADGRALQQAVLDAARPYLLRLVGPNCVGVIVPAIGLDASFSHILPPPGDLAFVSQSGAMITEVLDWAAPRGIGFSHIVSLGDMADVDFGDMLDYLAADPATRAVMLYVEAVTHARKFMSAARAAARNKPVLVVKVGRFAEGARAAASHTGAMAGADAVYEAAFRRAGMLRVETMAELFDAVETLALTRAQNGDRLAILTNGGGPGVMATDALIARGGRLAALSTETMARLDSVLPRTWSRGNPVDIIGDAPGQRYADALSALLDDPEVDAILVLNCPTALTPSGEAARAVIDTLATPRKVGRPAEVNLFTAWLGEQSAREARRLFAAARIPTYETPDSAVRGFLHRVHHRRNQELLIETPAARLENFAPDIDCASAVIAEALAAGRSWLDQDELANVLGAYGVPLPATRLVADAGEAAAAAAEIGQRVALKIRSPDFSHKSDVGGVVLDLEGAERVQSEAEAMLQRVARARPAARLDGFLVQEMVRLPGAVELIIGVLDDPVFGPVVMFGHGGKAVELIDDKSLEFPPLNRALAQRLMERTRVWRLLQGYRDQPAAAIDSVAEILIRVAQLAADHPEVREFDINPLVAGVDRAVAVDARLRVAPAQPRPARLAISPYPKDLETTETLRDGAVVGLRPIRPEDEPLLQDLARHMSPEDLRLRFFTAMKGLSHQLAARLSQLDYDREMALIALDDSQTALGVARFSADPDNLRAEYAVEVRSDWKGRGLGYLLMTRLIEVARRRGVGELIGEVLHENAAMLQMCRALGFKVAADPQDPTLLRVVKVLRD